MFWIGLVIGLFIGGTFGILAIALVAGGKIVALEQALYDCQQEKS